MSLVKYLGGHAEPRARDPSLAELAACGPWTHALVVPARRERVEDCLAVGAAVAARASTLTVLVVNAAVDWADVEAGEAMLAALAQRPLRWRGPGLELRALADDRAVLVVDGCREPWRFSARDGVGRARKLGADLVVALAERGALTHAWIHNSDADARLPAEHCARAVAAEGPRDPSAPRLAGVVAPFWHGASDDPGSEGETTAATAAYELSLRYYVVGLRHAGSPFAYHTIGSTISTPCWAYAAVRGFPLREAGEDFYLLTKLAKLGAIETVGGPPVEIRSRRSQRVPFGTGPAVEAMLGGAALEVYDPRVFGVLAALERRLAEVAASARFTGFAELEALAPVELGRLARALEARIANDPRAQLRARVREQFDGFRTLKLIHELSERWPRLPWAAAVRAAPFIDFDPALDVDEQRRRLAALELGPRPGCE